MKACRTIQGALVYAVTAGLVGAVVGGVLFLPLGYDGMRLGVFMGCMPAGLVTLLVKYPRYESDL